MVSRGGIREGQPSFMTGEVAYRAADIAQSESSTFPTEHGTILSGKLETRNLGSRPIRWKLFGVGARIDRVKLTRPDAPLRQHHS